MIDTITARQPSSDSELPALMDIVLPHMVQHKKKDPTSSNINARISWIPFQLVGHAKMEEEEPDTETLIVDSQVYGYSSDAQLLTNVLKFELESRINELCLLKAGWDGYNALPLSIDTKNIALNMLSKLFNLLTNRTFFINKFEIFPSSIGGFQFEIRISNKEIEIEYKPGLTFYDILYVEIFGDKEVYTEEKVEFESLPVLIDWLILQDV